MCVWLCFATHITHIALHLYTFTRRCTGLDIYCIQQLHLPNCHLFLTLCAHSSYTFARNSLASIVHCNFWPYTPLSSHCHASSIFIVAILHVLVQHNRASHCTVPLHISNTIHCTQSHSSPHAMLQFALIGSRLQIERRCLCDVAKCRWQHYCTLILLLFLLFLSHDTYPIIFQYCCMCIMCVGPCFAASIAYTVLHFCIFNCRCIVVGISCIQQP